MAYKFKGIERDKASLSHSTSSKIQEPNLQFGSSVMGDPNLTIEKVVEEHGISHISVDLIINRNENNFDATTVITLKQSIRQVGLLAPVLLWQTSEKKYVIIAGHRRVKAYREIILDLKNENAGEKEIEKYQTIPAIIFEIVDENDSRLGTDSKYITKETEKLMYEGSNMEARQLTKKDQQKHILYFYNMINNDKDFYNKLLEERNRTKTNKVTKLNLPDTISNIMTKDLGFSVSKSTVWRYISLLERKNEYPEYHEICMKRIENEEKIRTVFDDFDMAVKIKDYNHESKNIRREYLTRIEKGNEPIKDIYDECFNIKPPVKKSSFNKSYVLSFLEDAKIKGKTLEQIIEEISNM